MESIKDLCMVVHAANKLWWTDLETGLPVRRNYGEMLMLVTSELAESLEGDRKNMMDAHLPHRKAKEVELADALIRLLDIAEGEGMDLDGAFWEKMSYNSLRADHKAENRKGANGKRY